MGDRIICLHDFVDNPTTRLVPEGEDIVVVRKEALPGEDKLKKKQAAYRWEAWQICTKIEIRYP